MLRINFIIFFPTIGLHFKGPAKTIEYSFFNHDDDRS